MERLRRLPSQRVHVWVHAAEAMGLRQDVRTDISLGNSAEFFNPLDATFEGDSSTLHPYHSKCGILKGLDRVESAVMVTRGSSDEVELMFVYCDGGSLCSCKTSPEQWYREPFCWRLCFNLVHLSG